jgi:hypothetical protein
LTLFLAYHRLGIIPARIAQPILHHFVAEHHPFIFQDVTDVWHDLYYNTAIGNIADFPALYLSFGPNFAHLNIIKLF